MSIPDLRRLLLVGLVGVLALASAVLAPAPASAAGGGGGGGGGVAQGRDVSHDPAGDVVRLDLDRRNSVTARRAAPHARQGDIVRTVVRHSRETVVVRVTARELDRTGSLVRLFVAFRTGDGRVRYLVQEVRQFTGFTPGTLELQRRNGNGWRCEDARTRWRWGRDTVEVRVPRSCLGDPRTVQVSPALTTRYAPRRGAYLIGDDSYRDDFPPRPSYGPLVRSR